MTRTRRTFAAAAGTLLVISLAGTPAATAEGESTAAPVTPLTNTTCNVGAQTWAVTGNWDGIGGDGIGIVTVSGNNLLWRLRNAPNAGPADYTFIYGGLFDRPVVGNWDGVGGDGPGINRGAQGQPLQWHERVTLTGGPANYAFTYGDVNTDCAVATNADGVGGDGPGVVRYNGSKVEWHLRNGNNTGPDDFTFVFPG